MADLSKYGFIPDSTDQQQSSNTDLNKYGFVPDDDTNSPASNNANIKTQVTPQQSSTLEKLANNPVVDTINATGSGIRQGITDFGGEMGGLIAELVGKVNEKAGNFLKNQGNKLADTMTENESANIGKTPDQVATESPIASAIGKGLGYTGAVTATGGIGGVGLKGLATQGAIGAGMAGEGNRLGGATGGVLIPVAASKILGQFAKPIAAGAMQESQIKHVVDTLNKAPKAYPNMDIHQATQTAFTNFKNVPGAVDTAKAISSVDDYLTKFKSNLSPKQLNVIEELKTDLSAAKNIDELHIARKNFSSALSTITKKDILTGKAYSGIKTLAKDVENSLQLNANKLGVGDQYKEANILFKQSKEADIINDALKSSQLPEGGNNWLQFNNKIIKLKDDKAKLLSEPTKKMLTGVQKVLTEANHFFGYRTKEVPIVRMGLGIIGGLFNNPLGQQLLLRLGTQQGKALSKAFVESLANIIQSRTLTGGEASESTPLPDNSTLPQNMSNSSSSKLSIEN